MGENLLNMNRGLEKTHECSVFFSHSTTIHAIIPIDMHAVHKVGKDKVFIIKIEERFSPKNGFWGGDLKYKKFAIM